MWACSREKTLLLNKQGEGMILTSCKGGKV